MNTRIQLKLAMMLIWAALSCAALAAAPNAQLKLPNFDSLADKATQSVSITLDAALLEMAAGYLDDSRPEDAAAREVIGGLKGIYIKSFTFETDFAYPKADIDALRKQLAGPGWNRLVEVRSRKEQSHVDIYVSMEGKKANGLAIIASEPREFTIVNIVGSIDLDKLHHLEGKLGVPKMEIEVEK